jgi:AcrR family transcriptional regulator
VSAPAKRSSDAEAFATNEDALIEAGRRCFAEYGYAGSRLATIVNEVGLTTGAFYRRFDSKADFFHSLFVSYGEDLQAALAEAATLTDQFVAWIEVSRQHRGVVRASIEMLHRDAGHATTRQRLRGLCAGLLARHLEQGLSWRDARGAALILSDVLDQLSLMEAAGWIEERDPKRVAANLNELVEHGLYGQ